MAACISIRICALKTCTIKALSIILVHETLRARVSRAFLFVVATDRVFRVTAVLVMAQKVMVLPMKIAWRALIRIAVSLWNAASLMIFTRAIPIVAKEISMKSF